LAAEARALGYDTHKGPFAVIVAGDLDHEELGTATLSDLHLAARRATQQSYSEAALSGELSGLAVILAPLRNGADLGPGRRLAENVHRNALRLNADLNPIAAIGGATDLGHVSDSFAEARRTLRMMRAIPDLRPIAAWDELGVFRALALLPPEELQQGVLDSRVQQLQENEELAATAETFLDLAGNVQRTAEALFLHRATLYQRLDRIATLYDLDLRHNGHHRLFVHLSLKLARVAPP
ncbi:MAG TPA: helix-turn-helix domain-containing protein, partial [Solirubrobacterales bacterium]|nr:helix-turn-helix domain-containing protein [Solirubrobacterales bacterium]